MIAVEYLPVYLKLYIEEDPVELAVRGADGKKLLCSWKSNETVLVARWLLGE